MTNHSVHSLFALCRTSGGSAASIEAAVRRYLPQQRRSFGHRQCRTRGVSAQRRLFCFVRGFAERETRPHGRRAQVPRRRFFAHHFADYAGSNSHGFYDAGGLRRQWHNRWQCQWRAEHRQWRHTYQRDGCETRKQILSLPAV